MSMNGKGRSEFNRARRNFLGAAVAAGAKAAAIGVMATSMFPGSALAHRGRKGKPGWGPRCFLRGTAIATPKGEVLVESLRVGDRVTTVTGKSMAVRWIGRQTFKRTGAAWTKNVMPVRIARGALADGVPAKDLYLSPYHHLHVDGVLIQAKDLANGRSIAPAMPKGHDTADYFHILLDSHEIVLAEGAPAETFRIEAANYEIFANFAEVTKVMPDAATLTMASFAPVMHQRGRDHLKALLRTVVMPFAKAEDPIGDAHERLAERAKTLA